METNISNSIIINTSDGDSDSRDLHVGVASGAGVGYMGKVAQKEKDTNGQEYASAPVLVAVVYDVETRWVVGSGDVTERLHASINNLARKGGNSLDPVPSHISVESMMRAKLGAMILDGNKTA